MVDSSKREVERERFDIKGQFTFGGDNGIIGIGFDNGMRELTGISGF